MIHFHRRGEAVVSNSELTQCHALIDRAVWVDLVAPTREEEEAVEKALGFEVPTLSDMKQLELSQRLYREGDRVFMTVTMLANADTPTPSSSPLTFVLSPHALVTIRYAPSHAIETFSRHWGIPGTAEPTPLSTAVGLVDGLVERLADILESASVKFDEVSTDVFRSTAKGVVRRDFQAVLERIGQTTDLVSRAKESLTSLGRLVSFLGEVAAERTGMHATVAHLRTVAADLTSLGEHVGFLIGKATFLLDATLGLISNEQNGIIKFVSVLALIFGPPTLVASIYGMNFERMPELKWAWGYPMALAMMVVSAVLPYGFFKLRRWL